MRVRRRLTEGVLVVTVSGVLRASPRSIELFQQLVSAIGTGVSRVELDLQQVLFVDSLWLGFLVTLSTRCRQLGVTLRIPAVSKQVWRALEQTNVAQVLPPVGDHSANGAERK